MTNMTKEVETLETFYKEPVEFANEALKIFWLPDEINVEKDIQDVLTGMTEAERHAVTVTLKLFSLYELKAGAGYWNGWFFKKFKRPEFQRMASVFGMFELAVHKPFYTKLNELLHLDNDNFYLSYHDDKVLSERMEMIEESLSSGNDLLTMAAFSIIEGAILYSNFAFLKHFQSQGKNKLTNVVRGINFSVRDENIHSQAGAWAFRQYRKEKGLDASQSTDLEIAIVDVCKAVYAHEEEIIDTLFEKGGIEGITPHQLKNFVQSRLDICLEQLGYGKMYKVEYNPISKWFYEGINGFSFNDQFSGISNSYHRVWDESAFTFKEYKHE